MLDVAAAASAAQLWCRQHKSPYWAAAAWHRSGKDEFFNYMLESCLCLICNSREGRACLFELVQIGRLALAHLVKLGTTSLVGMKEKAQATLHTLHTFMRTRSLYA